MAEEWSSRTLHLTRAEEGHDPYSFRFVKQTYHAHSPGGGVRAANVLLRYAWPDTTTAPEEPSPRPEGGRILVAAWSAAGGAVPAEDHIRAVKEAARDGHYAFVRERDVLPNASYGRLRAALAEAAVPGEEPIAVVHLLCHGAREGETFGLLLNAEEDSVDKKVAFEDADHLRELFAKHAGRVRLVVLAACDSSNPGELGNALGSVAQAIHRGGVASVIASRYPLSTRGSTRLARSLYRALLVTPASVEGAFLTARDELSRGGPAP